ncbi:MAG: ribosomal RNA small subunit methyltransferase H [Bryobacteraceae bacterium]|nr:MAG: ribosomal RNA small subunit methyltransferase H [Bryobacteraceae bacterium]
MEHTPVLLRESLEFLAVRPDGVYVDCTCGLGGHTAAIAALLETGRVIALDRDAESLEQARGRCAPWRERIVFVQSSFSDLSSTLDSLGLPHVDGILADLGVSRYQLTSPERGFSLQSAGPLDMRMDRRQSLTAAAIVNHYSERELARIFEELGEERRRLAEKIARAVVRARPVADTAHLARVVASVAPRAARIHPATRVFQALRMAVNDEPGQLDALLAQAPERLAPGGRMVVIAFQSLDDRKVKVRFRELARQGGFRVLTRHVVRPGDEEKRANPASRSAVLRALERQRE